MIETPILTLNETQEGVRLAAFFDCPQDIRDVVANQQEVQAWLDLHLLNCGYYDDNNWFQPAWVYLLKLDAGLPVPGGYSMIGGLIHAPYHGAHDVNKRLEACGLYPIERHVSLLWSVLRWAQAGFWDSEIRCNAYEVGLVEDFIPQRRWAPIPPRGDLPDLATILGGGRP